MKFEIGERAVVNNDYDTLVPDEVRNKVVGMTGWVSGKVDEFYLWFMPDIPVERVPNDFGQWAVTADELDKLEV